jgi:tetratricopeptide (TPR) repeat protein
VNRLAVLLAAGLAMAGCTQSQTGVTETQAPMSTTGSAGSAQAASSILLAAAESQGDLMPLETSVYGDYLAGLVATHSRDFGAAADFMIRALGSDPDNLDLLRRAFVLTAAEGRHSESLQLARRLVDLEPANAVALLVLAVDAVVRDQQETARDRLAEQPERGLSILYGPLLNAWLRVGAGDLTGAQAEASGIDGREGFESLYLMHKALLYDVGGDTERAAEAYQDLLGQLDSPSLRFAVLAGNFFERQGQPESVDEIYAKYYLANPDTTLLVTVEADDSEGAAAVPILRSYKDGWAEVLFDLAGILSQERADEMALVHAHLALRLKPDLDLAHLLIGEIMEAQDRNEAAIEAYRRIDPAARLAWASRLRVADALGRMERTEEAVVELESLAAERPDSFEPLYRIGNLLRMQERFGEAADAYDRASRRVAKSEQHHWSLFYFRGISLERDGQWQRAEADFLKALELQPEQPYVMNYLAYSWVEQKTHLDEAQEMLVRAVELRPNDGYIVDSLGWVYYRVGDYEGAVTYLERAVELRPQDPVINDHLGDAYWRVGREQEARFQWRRSLSFKPEADQVPIIDAKIERGLTMQPENI